MKFIRTIKARSPLTAIPESYTIQHTINLFIPNLFSSKYSAKYFLTLLGDNILNKNSPEYCLHYFSKYKGNCSRNRSFMEYTLWASEYCSEY